MLDKKNILISIIFISLFIFGSFVYWSESQWADICYTTPDQVQTYLQFVNKTLNQIDIKGTQNDYDVESGIEYGSDRRSKFFNEKGQLRDIWKGFTSSVGALKVSSIMNIWGSISSPFNKFGLFWSSGPLNKPQAVFRDWKKLNNIDSIIQQKSRKLAGSKNADHTLKANLSTDQKQELNDLIEEFKEKGFYKWINSKEVLDKEIIQAISFLYSLNANTKNLLISLSNSVSYKKFCTKEKNGKLVESELCKKWNTRWDYHILEKDYNALLEKYQKIDSCPNTTSVWAVSKKLSKMNEKITQDWDEAMEAWDRGADKLKGAQTGWGLPSTNLKKVFDKASSGYSNMVNQASNVYSDIAGQSNNKDQSSALRIQPNSDSFRDIKANTENRIKNNMSDTMQKVVDIQNQMQQSTVIENPQIVTTKMPSISKKIYSIKHMIWTSKKNGTILYNLNQACENQCKNVGGICEYY